MKAKWFGTVALILVAISLLSVSSCGDPQELTSIQIQPSVETVEPPIFPYPPMPGSRCNLRRWAPTSTLR